MDAKAIVQHPAELKPPHRPRLVKLLPSNIRSSLKKYGQNIVIETLTTN